MQHRSLLSRLQELAILGANEYKNTADMEAINLEAEAIGDEFNRLMTTSTYKGKDVFVTTAGSEYVSLGGRDAEMTFGIGILPIRALWQNRTISGGPNDRTFNLASYHLMHRSFGQNAWLTQTLKELVEVSDAGLQYWKTRRQLI